MSAGAFVWCTVQIAYSVSGIDLRTRVYLFMLLARLVRFLLSLVNNLYVLFLVVQFSW